MFAVTVTLRKWVWIAALLLVLLAAGGLLRRALALDVLLAGLKVSAGTREQVARTLRELSERPVVLRWDGQETELLPGELGVTVDVERSLREALDAARTGLTDRLARWLRGHSRTVHVRPHVNIDGTVLREAVTARFTGIEQAPVPVRVRYGEPVGEVVGGAQGRTVDLGGLQQLLTEVLFRSEGRSVDVPVRSLAPDPPLAAVLGWERLHVLAEMSTSFDPAQTGRAANIARAAAQIDGIIVPPGAQFSLNAATGERNAEAGYQNAPVIIDGELVPGIGGGVSQLASTVFNAALLAGLVITEYHNHSLPVPYLPPGRDATVWFGALDLRFANPFPYPVVVNAVTGPDWVRVLIRAPHPPELQVAVETEVAEQYPAPREERTDPQLPPGVRRLEQQGRPGMRVLIRQMIRRNGQEDEVRTLEAHYRPQPEVWLVGSE